MKPEELNEYLSNVVDELDGTLIEKPGDTYYRVDVTRLSERDDGTLTPEEGATA